MSDAPASPALDHVVVNAMFGMDGAAALFGQLGFALTARGHHSLGSINHLIMFDDHYLELVGLPDGETTLRQEILGSTTGIDGLVFGGETADAAWARLTRARVSAGEPHEFGRPVLIDGVSQTARFRTTRLPAGALPAGRVYFCEHLSPQWVFRPEWTRHPNGARRLSRLWVVADDPHAEARRYATVAGAAAEAPEPSEPSDAGGHAISLGRFTIAFIDRDGYAARYGALASDGEGRESFFGALEIEVRDLDALRTRLAAQTLACEASPDRRSIIVRLAPVNTTIEFIGAV